MLGAAEADALGPEVPRGAGVQRGVGVGADMELSHLVGPDHELPELPAERRRDSGHRAEEDLAGAAVKRDDVARPDGDDLPGVALRIVDGDGHRLLLMADADRR